VGDKPLPCLHGAFLFSSALPPPCSSFPLRLSSRLSSFPKAHLPRLRSVSQQTILYDGCFRKHAYLFVLSAGCGHQPVFFGVRNGRQLKIDAPLSPTIFLPIFVFKFASGYAAPPVCSVGVILTAQRGLGDLPAGGSHCIFFSLSLFVSFSFIFIYIYIYIYIYTHIYTYVGILSRRGTASCLLEFSIFHARRLREGTRETKSVKHFNARFGSAREQEYRNVRA